MVFRCANGPIVFVLITRIYALNKLRNALQVFIVVCLLKNLVVPFKVRVSVNRHIISVYNEDSYDRFSGMWDNDNFGDRLPGKIF